MKILSSKRYQELLEAEKQAKQFSDNGFVYSLSVVNRFGSNLTTDRVEDDAELYRKMKEISDKYGSYDLRGGYFIVKTYIRKNVDSEAINIALYPITNFGGTNYKLSDVQFDDESGRVC